MTAEKYFWAFANSEADPIDNTRSICIVSSDTFLNVRELDYYIPYEITSLMEDLGFYKYMNGYFETTLRTNEEIKSVLDDIEFLHYNSDFQTFLNPISKCS